MALFNESLEGRFGKLVLSLHSMKGSNPIPQVAPEITHSIALHQDHDLYSHNYLAGVIRYASGFFNLAADATHFSAFDFSLSASSGVLATIEYVALAGTVAADVDIRCLGAVVAPGTTGNGIPLDNRETGTKKSAMLVTAQNTAIVGKSGRQLGVQTVGTLDTEIVALRGFVISPGTSLTIFSNVVNTALQLRTAIWRERAANPAELRTA